MNAKSPAQTAPPDIESLIIELRGHKVILDADLALIYGVPTKRLNEQIKRNASRFPSDFLFRRPWRRRRNAGVQGRKLRP